MENSEFQHELVTNSFLPQFAVFGLFNHLKQLAVRAVIHFKVKAVIHFNFKAVIHFKQLAMLEMSYNYGLLNFFAVAY